MKKRISLLLAVAVSCALLSGCSEKPVQTVDMPTQSVRETLVGDIPVTFPLVAKPQTLNILATGAIEKDQEDVFVWQKYEEMTGVNVNWTTVTKAERSEAYHSVLTNHQQCDLIIRCKMSASKLLRYGKSGLVLDLAKDGLLQENAPNCWAYLQKHPDTLASVMNPDGTIYGLPQVNTGTELRVAVKLFVNKLWLERVDGKLPTTTDELRELLIAFRDQDANGNGDPNDEIPFFSADWGNLQMALYGAFGLANRGFHNTTVDCDPVTGETRLIDGCDAYRDFLKYVHGLYEDGLMYRQFATVTTDEWQANINNDKIGVFPMMNLALLPVDKTDNWVAIDTALTGPNGDALWSAIRANFHSTGAAVIPTTCSDPELVLRWLDYFWTDEGTLFYHMGVEGETYQVLPDGRYDYLPKIYDEMAAKNLPFDNVVSEYSPYPGGSNPTVEIARYLCSDEIAIPVEPAVKLFEYGPEEYWPDFTFTQSEIDDLDKLKSDLSKYIDNMRVDFITGARSFDEWADYTAQLEKLGAAEKLQIYQAAVDRYHALVTALN